MDWKHEQQRRELKEEMARHEANQSVNIMFEMERNFERVFGGAPNVDSSHRRAEDMASAGSETSPKANKGRKPV